MKLIQVCNVFYPAPLFGTELVVYRIAQKAVEKGIQSVVITTDLKSFSPFERMGSGDEEYHNGIKIRRCKAYRFPKVYSIIVPELLKVLKEEIQNYDRKIIIHSHSYLSLNSFFAGFVKKFNNKVKLVHQPHYHPFPGGTWRGYLVRRMSDRTIGNFILRNANRIIVMSNAEKEMIKKFNRVTSQFSVITHGVDFPLQLNDEYLKEFKKLYNINYEEKVLLCVSRLGYEIVDFFAELLRKLNKNVKVLLVGSLWGNVNKKLILKRIQQSNPKGRLILTGYLPRTELPYAYLSADIFVKPAYFFEAFGIVFMEAMSYGLPIITHKIGALPEIISNEENGYLIEHSNSDVNDFRERINHLLENKSEYRRISECNKKKAKNYLWNNILEKYFKLYNELLSETR